MKLKYQRWGLSTLLLESQSVLPPPLIFISSLLLFYYPVNSLFLHLGCSCSVEHTLKHQAALQRWGAMRSGEGLQMLTKTGQARSIFT